jgi:hypothetical protein
MFFGMILGAIIEMEKLEIEVSVEQIGEKDLDVISERLSNRVKAKAEKLAREIVSYNETLFVDFNKVVDAIRGGSDADRGTGEESSGSGSLNGDDEKCPEDISELCLGDNDSTK